MTYIKVDEDKSKFKPSRNFTLIEYASLSDFASHVKKAVQIGVQANDTKWAGGTLDQFYTCAERGDLKLAEKAREHVKNFANVAVLDHGIEFEYNMHHGVLDYQTAMTGNPMCMYGATITESNRSPVHVYVDTWTEAGIDPSIMMRRGIAILAFVQALSIYRPVHCSIVKGSEFSPKRMPTVQTLQIPTAPMDLARAAWMLASPMVNRQGFLLAIHGAYRNRDFCPSPQFPGGWQNTPDMPRWMAERHNVKDIMHMKRMVSNDLANWKSDAASVAWVKKQLDIYIT
jgi:hypothetical protein